MSLRLVIFTVLLTVAGASIGFYAKEIAEEDKRQSVAVELSSEDQAPRAAEAIARHPADNPNKSPANKAPQNLPRVAITDREPAKPADAIPTEKSPSKPADAVPTAKSPTKPPPTAATKTPKQPDNQTGKSPAAKTPSKPVEVAALESEPPDYETSETVAPGRAESPEYTGSTNIPELPIRPKRSTRSEPGKSEPAKPAEAKAPRGQEKDDVLVTTGPTDAEAEETRGPVARTAKSKIKDSQASKAGSGDTDADKATTQNAEASLSDPAEAVGAESQDEDAQIAAQADLEKLLEPLHSYEISKTDLNRVRKAVTLIGRQRVRQGLEAMSKIKDADARLLVHWYGLTQDVFPETPERLEAFRKEHADWPELDRLRRIAERKLLLAGPTPERLKKFFSSEPPRTGAGMAGQAIVHLADGDKRKAQELAATAWRQHRLSASLEAIILKRLGSVLTAEDHKFRAHRILFSSSRSELSSALRLKKYFDKSERRKIDARYAAMRKSRSAGRLLSGLPAEVKKEPGVLHSRIRWLRGKKRYLQAWELLKLQPGDEESLMDPDAWWAERRILLREALDEGKIKTAYRIAKNHGSVGVNERNEAEFLAGWIALRLLKDAKSAGAHFEALKKSADGPRSRSRSHYWLGRTAKALGDSSEAERHFADGGKYFNTFYGQLSLRHAQPGEKTIDISDPPVPTEEDIKRFLGRSSAKAVVIAHKAGTEVVVTRILNGFRKLLDSPGELVLAAELGKQLGQTQLSLRIGKTGMFYGHSMEKYAYPTHALPDFKPLRPLPEKSIFYAITRQESEFNSGVVSHAGASGLMQVMPITAKHVARQHKIKYQRKKLISDPAYNVRIATAYIADRLDEFNGSYIKSIAGFNAGPGRVRQWVKKLGDPSDPRVDPIDWIERIPFQETRSYVKKVIANVQVYRARLGNPEQALQIDTDLLRGVKGKGSGLRRASN